MQSSCLGRSSGKALVFIVVVAIVGIHRNRRQRPLAAVPVPVVLDGLAGGPLVDDEIPVGSAANLRRERRGSEMGVVEVEVGRRLRVGPVMVERVEGGAGRGHARGRLLARSRRLSLWHRLVVAVLWLLNGGVNGVVVLDQLGRRELGRERADLGLGAVAHRTRILSFAAVEQLPQEGVLALEILRRRVPIDRRRPLVARPVRVRVQIGVDLVQLISEKHRVSFGQSATLSMINDRVHPHEPISTDLSEPPLATLLRMDFFEILKD
jgi:hypothetical protein